MHTYACERITSERLAKTCHVVALRFVCPPWMDTKRRREPDAACLRHETGAAVIAAATVVCVSCAVPLREERLECAPVGFVACAGHEARHVCCTGATENWAEHMQSGQWWCCRLYTCVEAHVLDVAVRIDELERRHHRRHTLSNGCCHCSRGRC